MFRNCLAVVLALVFSAACTAQQSTGGGGEGGGGGTDLNPNIGGVNDVVWGTTVLVTAVPTGGQPNPAPADPYEVFFGLSCPAELPSALVNGSKVQGVTGMWNAALPAVNAKSCKANAKATDSTAAQVFDGTSFEVSQPDNLVLEYQTHSLDEAGESFKTTYPVVIENDQFSCNINLQFRAFSGNSACGQYGAAFAQEKVYPASTNGAFIQWVPAAPPTTPGYRFEWDAPVIVDLHAFSGLAAAWNNMAIGDTIKHVKQEVRIKYQDWCENDLFLRVKFEHKVTKKTANSVEHEITRLSGPLDD